MKKLLWNYIVFLDDRPEITNGLLTNFFDGMGIEEGNFDFSTYAGKIGGVRIKHDKDDKARISYFLDRKKVDLSHADFSQYPVVVTQEAPKDDLPF
jgi:hypothetical protein